MMMQKMLQVKYPPYETMCKKAYDTWNERYNAEKNYNIFYSQMMKGEKRGD